MARTNEGSQFYLPPTRLSTYTVSHKNGANLFLSVTSWKINGFSCSFHC